MKLQREQENLLILSTLRIIILGIEQDSELLPIRSPQRRQSLAIFQSIGERIHKKYSDDDIELSSRDVVHE